MRKSSNSLRNLKTNKSTSQIRSSLPKVFSKITELYTNVRRISAAENRDCYDLQWISCQQQQLSKLFSLISKHISDKLYPQYLAKLESAGLVLANMRSQICNPHEKLNAIDVQFTTSTHQTSCDTRPLGVNMNLCDTRPKPRKTKNIVYTQMPSNSIEKLKQTIAVKESLLVQNYQKEKARLEQKEKYLGQKNEQIDKTIQEKERIETQYKDMLSASQKQLVQMAKEVNKQQDTIRNLEKQLQQQKYLRSQLQKEKQTKQNLIFSLSKLGNSNQIARLKSELESMHNVNSKIISDNKEKEIQISRLQQIIQSLSEEVATLKSSISTNPNQLMSELRKKNTIIQELAYQRENYSDGYAHLRQQQAESREIIEQLKHTIQEFERQLNLSQKEKQSLYQKISDCQQEKKQIEQHLQQTNQENNQLRSQLKVIRGELKGVRGQLRASQQRCDVLQERYFRLRQNCCDSDELTRTLTQKQTYKASKSVTERSEKVATANTYEKSTERQVRKLKVIGDLRDLVKNHRLNLR